MPAEFEWDQWNGRKSYLKHGITNLEAETIFDDLDKRIIVDEKHSDEEDR